jgi:hypothetical protein
MRFVPNRFALLRPVLDKVLPPDNQRIPEVQDIEPGTEDAGDIEEL